MELMEKWSRYQPLIQNWGSSMIHAAFTIQELYHFYDTLTMLWQLFNGKWEAVQTTQERILNNGH